MRTIQTVILSCCTLAALSSCTAGAKPHTTINRDLQIISTASFPSISNRGALVSTVLTVTNVANQSTSLLSSKPHHKALGDIISGIVVPAGFTMVDSQSTCASISSLLPGQSCTIVLTATPTATQTGTLTIQTPQGIQTFNLDVPVSDTVLDTMPTIDMDTTGLRLVPGSTNTVTVTNNSDTALNTPHLYLPSFLTSKLSASDLIHYGNLAPGESTSFTFTIAPDTQLTTTQIQTLEIHNKMILP